MFLNEFKILSKLDSTKILTLYLNVDPSTHDGKKTIWFKWAKTAAKNLQNQVKEEDLNEFNEISNKILNFLEAYIPDSKGLIVFAGKNLWKEYHLMVDLQNQIWWGRPRLLQFEAILSLNKRYGVLLFDKEKAKFFTYHLNVLTEKKDMELNLDTSQWRKQHGKGGGSFSAGGSGASTDLYANRESVAIESFWKNVGKKAEDIMVKEELFGIILGSSEANIKRFIDCCHNLKKHIKGTFVIDLDDNILNITNSVKNSVQEIELNNQREILDYILSEYKAGKKAGVGVEEGLKNLQMGKVSTIVVNRGLDTIVCECLDCGFVTAKKVSKCSRCASEKIREALIASIIPKLSKEYGSSLEIINEKLVDKLQKFGGVGFILRY